MRHDRVIGAASRGLAGDGFDLMLVYFRGPDLQSHLYWKHFREPAPHQVPSSEIQRFRERVPSAYEAVDRAVGELVAAASPQTNFILVSDHGFEAIDGRESRMWLDLNLVLEQLGYLERTPDDEIDWQRSRAVSWNSPPNRRNKRIRLGLSHRQPGGPIASDELAELTSRLASDLHEVRYDNGNPVFRVREAAPEKASKNGDLLVRVMVPDTTRKLFHRGREMEGVVNWVERITGTHSAENRGILLAAGPDIRQGTLSEAVRSVDVTPTVLYAMGLPVARDFDGRPQLDLFQASYCRAHTVKKIPTWGNRRASSAERSKVDSEIIRELTALGYLN